MDENENTVFVGNLDVNDVTEAILYELFLQAGPVQYVTIPNDKITKKLKPFGFVCFKDTESVPYAYYLLDGIKLFGKKIRVQQRSNTLAIPPIHEVGIHSLDPEHSKKEYDNSSNKHVYGNPHQNPPNSSGYGLIQQNASNLQQYGMSNPNNPLMMFYPQVAGQFGNFYGVSNTNNGLMHNNSYQYPLNPTQTIDTNSLNNFKNKHEQFPPYDRNRHDSYRNQNQDKNYGTNYHSNYRNEKRDFNRVNQDSYKNEKRSNLDGRIVDNRHNNSRINYDDRYSSPSSSRYNNDHYDRRSGERDHHRSKSHNSDWRHNNNRRGGRYN